jgi:DnaK suppressor protein
MTLDLEKFESELQTRAQELARSVAERNPIAIERSADAFDAAVLAAERESSAQTLTQDSRLLRQIEAARRRLRDGTYGICLHCGEAIAPKRIRAVPWAELCLSCQAMAEEATSDPGFATAA